MRTLTAIINRKIAINSLRLRHLNSMFDKRNYIENYNSNYNQNSLKTFDSSDRNRIGKIIHNMMNFPYQRQQCIL